MVEWGNKFPIISLKTRNIDCCFYSAKDEHNIFPHFVILISSFFLIYFLPEIIMSPI